MKIGGDGVLARINGSDGVRVRTLWGNIISYRNPCGARNVCGAQRKPGISSLGPMRKHDSLRTNRQLLQELDPLNSMVVRLRWALDQYPIRIAMQMVSSSSLLVFPWVMALSILWRAMAGSS